MSSSRSSFWGPLWLPALAAAALACSEAVTEPVAETAAANERAGQPTSGMTDVGESALGSNATRAMKIRATVALVDEVVPPPAPCLQLSASVIEGNATHLGRFEGVGSTCILDVVAPDPNPPFPAPGPPPYLTATFSNPLWELTAANDDELWLESGPSVCVISLADNSLRCEGSHTIVGGTGRFEGAIGELESGAVNEDGQGPDDFESHGWIRY